MDLLSVGLGLKSSSLPLGGFNLYLSLLYKETRFWILSWFELVIRTKTVAVVSFYDHYVIMVNTDYKIYKAKQVYTLV